MADELVSGLLKDFNLRVLYTQVAGAARRARDTARLGETSAELLAQGLASAALLGALQKSNSRMNLQIECDGPLHGMFVDANAEGSVRGYVKNRLLAFTGDAGEFRYRPVFGNKGFISVLRDQGNGEHYRSSIELRHFDLAKDLEAFFLTSDQVESRVLLEVQPEGEERLARVSALLLQSLPDGDRAKLSELGAGLAQGRFAAAVREQGQGGAVAVLKALFPGSELEVMSRFPVEYTCSCSKERVLNALIAMGRAELEDLLETEGKAEATCEFCSTQYVIGAEEIRGLIAQSQR